MVGVAFVGRPKRRASADYARASKSSEVPAPTCVRVWDGCVGRGRGYTLSFELNRRRRPRGRGKRRHWRHSVETRALVGGAATVKQH